MIRYIYFHTLVFICILLYADNLAHANKSTSQLGMVGLNTVQSARMDDVGTFRAGVSTSDPYNHAFIGLQIAKPLYINLRQSMEVSSITENPTRVYPGMDIKLRIADETRYRPEIAFGMDSILGHKRFSSEYFTLSKRYYNFDFTGGVAWGRLGSAGHLTNPFARLSSHFENDRDYNNENAASASDWFTGNDIGFFGGVEYSTPVDGLSLKADFNADAYAGETLSSDFKSPSPWSVGFNYSPKEWVSLGASMIGADKIMARLSFQGNLFDWNGSSYKTTIRDESKRIEDKDIKINGTNITGVLHLNNYEPSTLQIGRAAKSLAINSAPDIKTIKIIPMSNGTQSTAMTFSRRDLEQATLRYQGSPEEIWQDLEFTPQKEINFSNSAQREYKILPELSFSLGEEETTHLYRAAIVGEEEKKWGYGFLTGNSFRLNIADNLNRIAEFRDINTNAIRSDIDLYTLNRINMDKSFLSFLNSPLPNFHLAATVGYLEEMFAGYGGEVLYRPHQSPFAVGVEGWNLYKRDPLTALSTGLYPDTYKTGFLNLYYEVPDTNITAFAKIGRFIGGDDGVNFGAQTKTSNGMKIKGSFSITNAENKDVFDSRHNMYGGLELSIPFGHLKYIPQGSAARITTSQMGRDDAAMVNKPIDLYDVTEPISYRHLGQNWQEVLN